MPPKQTTTTKKAKSDILPKSLGRTSVNKARDSVFIIVHDICNILIMLYRVNPRGRKGTFVTKIIFHSPL